MGKTSVRISAGVACYLFGLFSVATSVAQVPDVTEGERYWLQTRVVHGDTGEPAAGVEVSWIGSRGAEQCIVTGSNGELEVPLGYAFGWLTLLYGRQDGLVTQALPLISEQSLNTELILGAPASLMGTIHSEDGTTLEGCIVRLCDNIRGKETHFETRTDSSGGFIFVDLPPGEYYVRSEHAAYFAQPAWGTTMPPQIAVFAGVVSYCDLTLYEKTRLKGRVLGPDGTGAAGVSFGVPGYSDGSLQKNVTTDEAGNFEVQVVPDERSARNAEIHSETLGSGSFWIPSADPGDVIKGITVQLHGVARVSGTVRGPNGEPVAGVRVRNAITDGDGHFETGFIALPGKGTLKVNVEPPIWMGPQSISRMNPIAPQLEPDAVFYKDSAFTLAAKHGDVLNKDIILDRIRVRTLRGSVQDANGGPAAHATVAIYGGSAPARLWLEDLAPYLPPLPVRVPQMPYQTMMSFPPAVILARIPTDEQGRWEVRVLSENKNFNWIVATDYVNLQELTIAAADSTLEHTALKRLQNDGGGDAPIEANLILDPIPDDLVTHAYVTDEGGAPLPDVSWRLNGINGPFVSDEVGRVTFPRLASRLELSLVNSTLRVLSAVASGEIVRPPVPTSDPQDGKKPYSSDLEFRITGPNFTEEAPYIRFDAQSVSYSEFDASKGKISIAVGRADSVAAGH